MRNSESGLNKGVCKTKNNSKRQRRKKNKSLYEQYLADSASDHSSLGTNDGNNICGDTDVEFAVGMDINILIQQTIQNTIQSVCLVKDDGSSSFGDRELLYFAATVKNNNSIVSLQIRYLDVTDFSLVPLCFALQKHLGIRALDLSGTRGGEATSKALCSLVCTNSSIIFVRVEDTFISAQDAEVIQLATRYNALSCADPNSNPFHLGLLRKISIFEKREHDYTQQLNAKPWLFSKESDDKTAGDAPGGNCKKKITLSLSKRSKIGAEMCPQFAAGYCPYGSRCKYFHPEKTSAIKNAVTPQHLQRERTDPHSTACSSVASPVPHHRLQSRLRPSEFTLKPRHVDNCRREVEAKGPASVNAPQPTMFPPEALSLWTLSVVLLTCSIILISYI